MMGRIDNQMQLLILDLDSMIPENHLLRQIKNSVNFDFIYEKASSFYSHTGSKSIDPVVMIKMLLIGYLYGIKSERRLEEEVSLNLAYRWFCELDLMQKIPDHSTFSQNRRRRFRDNTLFRDIFNEIIMQCINMGIVSGRKLGDFFKSGWFSFFFAIIIPLINGCIVAYLSQYVTTDIGNRFIFAVLASSASYIAVPAAMKIAVPKANPGIFLPMALAVTFPFNITFGMPIYLSIVLAG